MSEPQLSVVIACWNGFAGLRASLSALERAAASGLEVNVVANRDLAVWPDRYRWVRFLRLRNGSMTPRLWAAGMDIATGAIVAITTSHFLPAPDYEAAILSSHQRLDAGGIGGRIEPPIGNGPVAWAVYLLRYSEYLGLAARPSVEDFAGDNGSYKTSTLAGYRDQIRAKGFWEHELHQQMSRDGIILVYDPTIEVRQAVAFPFLAVVSALAVHSSDESHTMAPVSAEC